MNKKFQLFAGILISSCIFGIIYISVSFHQNFNHLTVKDHTRYFKVSYVIDGDTFEIETGQRVRMIGMNTPEIHHPKKPVQCFGQEAFQKTQELLEGQFVRLEKDVSNTDQYGRLLRYVYLETHLDNHVHNELFINEYLVKEGFAYAYTFPPDVSRSALFIQLEHEAMYNQKGLWKKCK